MRVQLTAVIAIAIALCAPHAAFADAPTQADLDAAKQAFAEGNTLYKGGKFAEAVSKLRESYRLSRNPVLLYNIGFIQEQAGLEDQALFYYRTFLADAPATAPMLAEARARVVALESEGVTASADPDAPPATPSPPPPKKIEIEHPLIDSAPYGLPIDITAVKPDDDTLKLTVFYRVSGEATFTPLAMFVRKANLVARIPAARVVTKQVQYYIEARDAAGKVVTRSGRSTAPNLVTIEATAKPQYDVTMADDGTDAPPVIEPRKPLPPPIVIASKRDAGRPFPIATVKWVSTGVAGALLGTALVSYLAAGSAHDRLVADSASCGTPPCREFDGEHARALQSLGERYDTVYKVTLIAGIGVAGVAGYFWYRDLRSPKKPRERVAIVPAIGDGYLGIAAVGSVW